MKEPEVSEKFSISAEIYDDEATHGYRPLSCRRARIIKSLLFLVFLKTNAQNTSKKFLVETCGHIELRTMMIKYYFFFHDSSGISLSSTRYAIYFVIYGDNHQRGFILTQCQNADMLT